MNYLVFTEKTLIEEGLRHRLYEKKLSKFASGKKIKTKFVNNYNDY